MHRRLIVVTGAAAVLAVVVGVIGYRYTASSQAQYALKVNSTTYSPADVATRVASVHGEATAVAHVHLPDMHVKDLNDGQIVNILVTEALELQEAQRRGISCTRNEAHDQQATYVAGIVNSGQAETIIVSAVSLGIVPDSYLDTPEAQRTPTTNDVIAAYLSSPVEYAPTACIVGKLFAQVRQAAGGGNVTKGEQAITDLESRLRASATIQGPALTSSTTGTTTSIPTPTPGAPPPLGPVAGLGIAVGAPSLSGGKVRVPVNSTGTGVPVYSAFNTHLRWNSAVFSFDSANLTGGVIPSGICAAFADSDGGGARYACIAGAETTATGLLATIVLSPAASGCSSLHLFTLGAPDNGDEITGTFILRPDGEALQPAQYVDGSANVGGQVC